MREYLFVIAFCLIFGIRLSAQEKSLFRLLQFGLTYTLSMNAAKANEYTNGASANLQVGILRNENNFTQAGFSNVVSGMIRSVQFVGLLNIAKISERSTIRNLNQHHREELLSDRLDKPDKKGEEEVEITYDVLGNTIVSFRSGRKYTYGILGVGSSHKIRENDKIAQLISSH